MSLISRRLLLLVVIFSFLVTWSHWNIFSGGVVALGINYSLFCVGVAIVFYSLDNGYSFKRDWVWLCPIILIGLSFSVYENPWLKWISLFVLPLSIAVFCIYAHFNNHQVLLWNSQFLRAVGLGVLKPVSMVEKVTEQMLQQTKIPPGAMHVGVISSVLRGFMFLIPLSVVVILLLSSADDTFAKVVFRTIETLFDAVSWVWLLKLVLSVVLAITLLSLALGWSQRIEYNEVIDAKTIDGLVASIVLGGLLVIYVAFLSLQLDNLVVETLPENYREAEKMVKSGFWQLFLLAVLNTGLFFIVYRKTGQMAQWVLRVFIVASSLLMVSAAWKVWLYSYTFGLSYEKFFACYTAVFALGVLLYLVTASFSTHRRNVVKVIAFSALWCYGIATVSPVEKAIFNANLYFAEQDNTRITVWQLTQLSLDIMSDVDEVYETKLLEHSKSSGIEWRDWREQKLIEACDRAWYEFNISAAKACRSVKSE